MKKFVSILLALIALLSTFVPTVFAEDNEMKMTIDVNQRYTNILENDPSDIYLNDAEREKEKQEKENRKIAYVVVLSVLLVIAIGVLIYTIKKAPDEEEIKNKIASDNSLEPVKPKAIVKDEIKSEEKDSADK